MKPHPPAGTAIVVHDADDGHISLVAAHTTPPESTTTITVAGHPYYIFGSKDYVHRVKEVLNPHSGINNVDVYWATWTLTPTRDTVMDVIAACIAVIGPRHLLNTTARDIVEAEMPELTDDDNNRDDVIYY